MTFKQLCLYMKQPSMLTEMEALKHYTFYKTRVIFFVQASCCQVYLDYHTEHMRYNLEHHFPTHYMKEEEVKF